MKKTVWLWIIAFILTLVTAAYQRMTGPTYPISGKVNVGEKVISYSLDRSHGGSEDHLIKIKTDDPEISGLLQWKRYKTNDSWKSGSLVYEDGLLMGTLPHQPPAGKLIYKITLIKNEKSFPLNDGQTVVIRFKGDVPAFIIIPHVIFMFLAMMLSVRTGLEFFNNSPDYKKLVYWTLIVLLLGGMVFGPIMQKYAFGEYWTGVPFGFDLTDNKTLLAVAGWIIAIAALKKSAKPYRWIIFASVFMFIIYLIPHSVLGSELDYNELDKQQNKIEKSIE